MGHPVHINSSFFTLFIQSTIHEIHLLTKCRSDETPLFRGESSPIFFTNVDLLKSKKIQVSSHGETLLCSATVSSQKNRLSEEMYVLVSIKSVLLLGQLFIYQLDQNLIIDQTIFFSNHALVGMNRETSMNGHQFYHNCTTCYTDSTVYHRRCTSGSEHQHPTLS